MININTTPDLLKQAYVYHTDYETKLPKIIQKKYINIPTTLNKEESIVQKHTIGSFTYTISRGKKIKQKALKIAFNT